MLNTRNCAVVVLAMVVSCAIAKAEAPKPYLISSFEPDKKEVAVAKNEAAKIVKDKDKASDGEYCLQVKFTKNDYNGLEVTDKATLAKFKDYLLLKVDVFNPQSEPIVFNITMADSKSKSWGMKHNGSATAAPGKSTVEVNLTGLNRSNAKGNTSTDMVDPADLTLLTIFSGPSEKPLELYFDNLRLEPSELPVVEGLKAIDFGMKGSPVYPGFVGCTQKNVWDDKAEFGWVNPGLADNCQIPDALTGDFGSGEAFKMKLPNGKYELHACFDPFGNWGRLPSFTQREVLINGKQVLSETMNGKDYLEKVYYAHEDDEDLPGQNLWQKFILPRNKVHTFEAEVTDGVLTVEVKSPDKHGKWITFLVVYPESKKEDGRKFMETLQKSREEKFNKKVVITVAPPDGDEVTPTAEDKARGFVPFVRNTELDIAVTARPYKDEIGKGIELEAAGGQRCSAQIGLYPLKDLEHWCLDISSLKADGGLTIPASAVTVAKVRNFFKRPGRENIALCQPLILQTLHSPSPQCTRAPALKPGVTRGLWVTLTVPEDAKPGTYKGSINLHHEDITKIPITLTVLPFKLDKVTDISLSVTGANSYAWRPWFSGLEDVWWKGGELVMKDLADHGMNCINGGPSAKLSEIKDAKAVIDYTDYDRWMDMAMKAGLDKMADGYGGLSVEGLPRDSGPDCIAVTEKDAQARFGMSFKEVLKIAFADFDKHQKDKGYPRRAYYFLDEPRAEWNNIDSAAELIKVYTAACPDTLFSGYYSPGGRRDEYFKTMPMSIAHAGKHTLELTKSAGKMLWEYNGENVRYNIGRYLYVASRAGLAGYLRNGYMFVCGDPYFDFSADEASWCVVYPSKNGLNGTTGWERTGEGVTDYRYLAMCDRLIKKARSENKAAAEADAAEAFMKANLKDIDIDNNKTAKLTPAQYDEFRHTLAGHVTALVKALGEK